MCPTHFVLFRQVPDLDASGARSAEFGNLVIGQFLRRAEAHPLVPSPRDPFRLAFFPEVHLELGDRGQESEYELAGRGRGVDCLVKHDEPDVVFLQLLENPVQIEGGARQAVEAGDHQDVAAADEPETFLQSRPGRGPS